MLSITGIFLAMLFGYSTPLSNTRCFPLNNGGSTCFTKPDPLVLMSWSGAMEWCKKFGGKLPTPDTGTNNVVYGNAVHYFGLHTPNLWLGANFTYDQNNWFWTNGSRFSGTLEGRNIPGKTHAYIVRNGTNVKIVATSQADTCNYLCQNSYTASLCSSVQNSYWTSGKCYKKLVNYYWTSWDKYLDTCGPRNLAIIDDLNDFSRWLENLQKFWIGLRCSWWTWIDIVSGNSYDVTETKFGSLHDLLNGTNAQCLASYNGYYDGQYDSTPWTNKDCNNNLPFICQHDANVTTPTSTTRVTTFITSKAETSTSTSSTQATTSSFNTETTATTSATGTTEKDCVARALDLVFVVDGSGSICNNSPYENGHRICNNWKFILKFMEDFVSEMDIGLNATRVALVTFASTAIVNWNLTRYTNKFELIYAIHNLPYPAGSTETADGLRVMRTQVFGSPGDRPFAKHTAIIITDGQPSNPQAVPPEINAVHSQGITTYVIGVTSSIIEQTLQLLSSAPQQKGVNYFIATDFSAIGAIRRSVESAVVCKTTVTTAIPTSFTVTTTKVSTPVTSSTSDAHTDSTTEITSRVANITTDISTTTATKKAETTRITSNPATTSHTFETETSTTVSPTTTTTDDTSSTINPTTRITADDASSTTSNTPTQTTRIATVSEVANKTTQTTTPTATTNAETTRITSDFTAISHTFVTETSTAVSPSSTTADDASFTILQTTRTTTDDTSSTILQTTRITNESEDVDTTAIYPTTTQSTVSTTINPTSTSLEDDTTSMTTLTTSIILSSMTNAAIATSTKSVTDIPSDLDDTPATSSVSSSTQTSPQNCCCESKSTITGWSTDIFVALGGALFLALTLWLALITAYACWKQRIVTMTYVMSDKESVNDC